MAANADPAIDEYLDELFHNLLPEPQSIVERDRMARGKYF